MNSAIQCTCGSVIFYSQAEESLTCPNCQTDWFRAAPPMYSADGSEAKCVAHLCRQLPEMITDTVAAELLKRCRAAGLSKKIFFIFGDGRHVDLAEGVERMEQAGK
jgi:hypothetical protein